MKRLGNKKSEIAGLPYSAFYRVKAGSKPHKLERILKPKQVLKGTYETTFTDKGKAGTEAEGLEFKTHLFIALDGKSKFTVKGFTSINNALEGVKRGTPLQIVYVGPGKISKGKKRAQLFEVYDISDEINGKETAVETEGPSEATGPTDDDADSDDLPAELPC